jgi:succinate dehydrogenase / fumarate reductase cytochrome b subunit
MAPSARPLSPHLQIYRWYFTMALSIAHRASGVALTAGLVLLAAWLVALASGPEAFAVVHGLAGSVLGRLVLLGLTLVLFYHGANGVRHLVWDMGYGLDPAAARRSGMVTLAVAAAATAATWLAVLALG